MKTKRYSVISIAVILLLVSGFAIASDGLEVVTRPEQPVFREVSVHDPVAIKVDGTYYVFGSHLASARSDDLIKWVQISTRLSDRNQIIPQATKELAEPLQWAGTDSTWAPGILELNDEYLFYYCVSTWGSPRSAIGIAKADQITGPYKDHGMFLNSGLHGNTELELYNRSTHPNAIDPDLFFDAEGRLWMVYGSYFGGMFILEMDPQTGLPLPDQGYGKKLMGGRHAAMEGPHIQYNPETGYYYLFVSYGTLDATGGYNIRVVRSKNPDGPYYDPAGYDVADAVGQAAPAYGAKLMGNFLLTESNVGYVSPGHNSTFYDQELEKNFIFFHTRFPGRGERHNVRVHQMLMNSEDWPVIMPHRYGGETVRAYELDELVGTYQYLNHGKGTTHITVNSSTIELTRDGQITGAVTGTWEQTGDYTVDFVIGDVTYHGAFLEQWDSGLLDFVMTFSALSERGITIWGSQVVK